MKPLPDAEYLNACFEYVDGVLFWKLRPANHFKTQRLNNMWNKTWPGKLAGRPMPGRLKYWQTMLNGKRYLNHRLIAGMFGLPLDGLIDHIDGNPQNNRIENLRACSRDENARNNGGWAKRPGLRGIYQRENGRWTAAIRIDGRLQNLGTYESKEEAKAVRLEAQKRVYGAFGAERGVEFAEPVAA